MNALQRKGLVADVFLARHRRAGRYVCARLIEGSRRQRVRSQKPTEIVRSGFEWRDVQSRDIDSALRGGCRISSIPSESDID